MLKYDCKYFSGDKPCNFHKEYKIKCDFCDNYDPVKFKILIIKLDAIGDVLRTTSILQPLKLKYPDSHITWCTKKNAKDLFIQNGYVDEIITIEEDAQFRLSTEEFDILINLDSSKKSSAIAAMVKSKVKKGFVLDKKGSVIPQSPEADHWLLMSAFDDIKKENKRSYQKIIYEILGLDSSVALPVLNIPE
ncbi:MAG: hypothetical protein R3255_10765, partial [Candidatus Lokiarchaeia archaeon]|nr:hypothetical protein [Candidatus Lokiarchaeia archaeon]